MRKGSPTLAPQELAIMKVVWRLQTATVRDVYEAFREEAPHRLQDALHQQEPLRNGKPPRADWE